MSSQSTLEDWSQWLDSLLNDLLKPYAHLSGEKYTKQAKQILLNWSFYCSMVIRDLTLRSAASFGSFHLIRLLYDEYLFSLIEHKIALHTQKTPIAVMAEVKQIERKIYHLLFIVILVNTSKQIVDIRWRC